MRIALFAAAAALTTIPACISVPEVTAQVGYAQMAVDGDIGYVDSSNSQASISQDVESAFGLGDDQGIPYGRVMLDLGTPVLAVSGFALEDSGTGVLQATFGESQLVAGTPVNSNLELFNAKASLAFDIPFGPVTISPGLCANYFDLKLEVRDLIGIANEQVELNAPIPLAFIRGEVDLAIVSGVLEIGYMAVDVEDVDVKFLDVEALAMVHPTPWLNLFAGYRMLALDAEGEVDDDRFDADLEISGFIIGGGLRF